MWRRSLWMSSGATVSAIARPLLATAATAAHARRRCCPAPWKYRDPGYLTAPLSATLHLPDLCHFHFLPPPSSERMTGGRERRGQCRALASAFCGSRAASDERAPLSRSGGRPCWRLRRQPRDQARPTVAVEVAAGSLCFRGWGVLEARTVLHRHCGPSRPPRSARGKRRAGHSRTRRRILQQLPCWWSAGGRAGSRGSCCDRRRVLSGRCHLQQRLSSLR
jgi:hypothetical protein